MVCKEVRVILLVLLMGISISKVKAQKVATNFESVFIAQQIKDWERAKLYTDEILEVLPADKLNFKPEKDAMIMAEQFLHLAKYNFRFAAAISDNENPYGNTGIQKQAGQISKDSLVAIVDDSYQRMIDALKKSDTSQLNEKPAKQDLTRFVILEKAFEHQTHHRGSIVLYLHLSGIIPPHERLF